MAAWSSETNGERIINVRNRAEFSEKTASIMERQALNGCKFGTGMRATPNYRPTFVTVFLNLSWTDSGSLPIWLEEFR